MTDVLSIQAKLGQIQQQIQLNAQAKANNDSNTTQNTTDQTKINTSITTTTGEISQNTQTMSGISGDIDRIKSSIEAETDEVKREEMQNQIDSKELELSNLEQTNQGLEAKKTNDENALPPLIQEADVLTQERTSIELQEQQLNQALIQAEAELKIFEELDNDIDELDPDNVTPESIDNAFDALKAEQKAKGNEIVSEENGKITFKDGTVIHHTPGKSLTITNENLGNGYGLHGQITTSETPDGQNDSMFYSVSTNTVVDENGQIIETGRSVNYDYQSNGQGTESTEFGGRTEFNSNNGSTQVNSIILSRIRGK